MITFLKQKPHWVTRSKCIRIKSCSLLGGMDVGGLGVSGVVVIVTGGRVEEDAELPLNEKDRRMSP